MGYKARVKYKDEEWLVIDSFSYNGKKYMYLATDLKEEMNSEEDLNKYKDKIKMIFIENVDGENYRDVEEQNLLDDLNVEIVKRNVLKK